MAALRAALGSQTLRAVALPAGHLRRRAGVALSRPRWPRPERLAFAVARRWHARRLFPADRAARADRQGRGRRAFARSRARPQVDRGSAAILPCAISGRPGRADSPGPFGAVLSRLRVRTDRRAL